MSSPPNKNDEAAALTKVENELKHLRDELSICQEAKTIGEACEALCDHAEKEEDSFRVDTAAKEPNEWHKKAAGGGGGGCIIL
mmetsp:Transcript_28289/g.41054  ORF Transcript_28289/g.41054 Transcript_28289/m.41054 type:complete len:83 (+) Transcript_28289:132-380(+)